MRFYLVEKKRPAKKQKGSIRWSVQLHLSHFHFRNELLKQLINLYRESDAQTPDFVQMVQCLIFLDDTDTVAGILETLSQGNFICGF